MNHKQSSDLGSVAGDLRSVLGQGLSIGFDLLDSALNFQLPDSTSRLLRELRERRWHRSCCGCDIPPPCWWPIDLGRVTSHPCRGGTATLRIRVENASLKTRTIKFTTGTGGPTVTFTPASLTLGPMDSGWVSASITAPHSDCDDEEAIIWVRGCREHYLRWYIRPVKKGADCCHEIEVEDGPEMIHHWYDHFYCARPCTHRA
jgi:hypothetical protein